MIFASNCKEKRQFYFAKLRDRLEDWNAVKNDGNIIPETVKEKYELDEKIECVFIQGISTADDDDFWRWNNIYLERPLHGMYSQLAQLSGANAITSPEYSRLVTEYAIQKLIYFQICN